MTTFLTEFLWVILIVLPNSTWQSTLPGHPTIFPTKLSSVLTVWWYPTCVLEFNSPYGVSNRSLLNTGETTLSYFRSLFKDHTRPIIVYQLSSSRRITFTEWIIYFFKERFGHFRIVLQIYDIYFYLSSNLFYFFEIWKLSSFYHSVNLNLKSFTNLQHLFQFVKLFVKFFFRFDYRVSFIPYKCQIFYKLTANIW